MGVLAIIAAIYIIVKLCQDAATDDAVRRDAINRGMNSYMSSTGWKDVKTGKPRSPWE